MAPAHSNISELAVAARSAARVASIFHGPVPNGEGLVPNCPPPPSQPAHGAANGQGLHGQFQGPQGGGPVYNVPPPMLPAAAYGANSGLNGLVVPDRPAPIAWPAPTGHKGHWSQGRPAGGPLIFNFPPPTFNPAPGASNAVNGQGPQPNRGVKAVTWTNRPATRKSVEGHECVYTSEFRLALFEKRAKPKDWFGGVGCWVCDSTLYHGLTAAVATPRYPMGEYGRPPVEDLTDKRLAVDHITPTEKIALLGAEELKELKLQSFFMAQ